MNINIVKNNVLKHLGERHKFKAKGSRGQDFIFYGTITKCFPFIFIIVDDDKKIYSFSYSDFLISNIEIIDVK